MGRLPFSEGPSLLFLNSFGVVLVEMCVGDAGLVLSSITARQRSIVSQSVCRSAEGILRNGSL
jgi:hypothetical protein